MPGIRHAGSDQQKEEEIMQGILHYFLLMGQSLLDDSTVR